MAKKSAGSAKSQKMMPRAPKTEDLLSMYLTAGCPRKKGWLYHVQASSTGVAWAVLYTRMKAEEDELTIHDEIEEAQLIGLATKKLRGKFARLILPEIQLAEFEFPRRDELLQFRSEAERLLREDYEAEPSFLKQVKDRILALQQGWKPGNPES